MTEQKNFKNKVLTGFYWLTGVTWVGQIFSWVVTLIIIRLLTPEDYGLLSMALVLTGFLNLLSEMGLGSAIIQKKEIVEEELRKLFGCVIIFGVILSSVLWASAPLVASFFSEPKIIPIIQLLSVNFILLSFYFLPRSLLQRDINYKKISIINLTAVVCCSGLTLFLALKGYGTWALAWGIVCIHFVKVILYNLDKTVRYSPIFSLSGIGDMLQFGGYTSISRVVWYFYSQADIVIAGRFFGKEQLGDYSLALQLISIPLTKIGAIAQQIGLPAFSHIQDNLPSVQQNFLKAVRVLSLVFFPIYLGMASVADVFVPILLGDKWINSIVFIQILCIIMPLRVISTFYAPVVSAIGRPDVHAGNMVIAFLIMPAAFLIGSKWGMVGLCLAWLVAFPVYFVISTRRVLRHLSISFGTFTRELYLPISATLSMFFAVYLFKNTQFFAVASPLSLMLLCLLGAVVYLTVVYGLNRNVFTEFKLIFLKK